MKNIIGKTEYVALALTLVAMFLMCGRIDNLSEENEALREELARQQQYVPDESVEAYKTATNWSNWAGYIYPISEYTE